MFIMKNLVNLVKTQILIAGTKLEQHVASDVEHVVLLLLSQNKPQHAGWREYGAFVTPYKISKLFRQNPRFLTEFDRHSVWCTVERDNTQILRQAAQSCI